MPYDGQNQHVVIFGVVAYNLRPTLDVKSDSLEMSGIKSRDVEGVDDDRTLREVRLDEEDPIETCYRDLFVQCWQPDPRDRPVAVDLVDVFSIWKMYL